MSQKVQGLNKEFSKKDVERMRHLIKVTHNEKHDVGYRVF